MQIPLDQPNRINGTFRAPNTSASTLHRSQTGGGTNGQTGDSASFSIDVKLITARTAIIRLAFESIEYAAGSPGEAILEEAGKKEALDFGNPMELTPQKTADFISRSIQDFGHHLFGLNNPDIEEEDLFMFSNETVEQFKMRLLEFRKTFVDDNTVNQLILFESKQIEEWVEQNLE